MVEIENVEERRKQRDTMRAVGCMVRLETRLHFTELLEVNESLPAELNFYIDHHSEPISIALASLADDPVPVSLLGPQIWMPD